ncbi:MAG: site-specific integrase [Candidatus Bathyarchaeota archaeon]|nr:site-specific integrase [Candidatus Bathyarchaeota archaeon]MDH5664081.1 site-specific integrase [Candidatus Bathyarchaeota archaeon]
MYAKGLSLIVEGASSLKPHVLLYQVGRSLIFFWKESSSPLVVDYAYSFPRQNLFNIDIERKTVTVNDPEKGSNPRILNIGSQLAARLELLAKHTEYVFRKTYDQPLRNWTTNFLERRKTIARKLNNPRLLKISFKTFRHFKGTLLYHKTKDVLYVKERLGHKNIQNTLIYIHLEAAIFKSGDHKFTVRTAKTLEEAKQLLEVGFEYVTEVESVKLFRKRK